MNPMEALPDLSRLTHGALTAPVDVIFLPVTSTVAQGYR